MFETGEMNTDMEEQEDELLALQSIFSPEEFVREESKAAGEIRVSVELSSDFTVAVKEGEKLRQYEVSFLPPLLLTFELPEDYPSSSPPSFTLTCTWLTHTQISALVAQLTELYQASGGTVVLFSWAQFLKEDALRFLDIHTLLQLPSDEPRTQSCSQDSLYASPPEPKNSHHTPDSGPTEKQSWNVSDQCGPATSAPSLEVEHPVETLADGQNPSTSDWSSTSPMDESEHGAAPLAVKERSSPQNEDQTICGLSLTPLQRLLSQILIYDAAQQQKQFDTTVFECGVCFVGCLGSDCVQLPGCGHVFCQTCLAQFYKLQITEGNVQGVTCPQDECTATPTPAQVKSLVGEDLFNRYDLLLLQNTLDSMPDVVYCPRLSCSSAVIQDKSSKAAVCPVCYFAFCVACRKTFHGTVDCQGKKGIKKQQENTQGSVDMPQTEEGLKALWDDYKSGSKQRKHLLESRYGRIVLQNPLEWCLSENWIAINSKNCPHCFCRIEKNGGCNSMTCSQCRRRFCWACLTGLSTSGKHFENTPCSLYQF